MPCVALSWRANSSIAVDHVQRSEDRALGIVLVGDRSAEEREHRVALELGDRAFVAEDGLRHEVERFVDDRRSSPRDPSARPGPSTRRRRRRGQSPACARRSASPPASCSISGAGAAAISRAWAASSPVLASVSAWPQLAQNRASGATLASQRGQVRDGNSTVIGAPSYRSRFRRPGIYGRSLFCRTVTCRPSIRILAQPTLFVSLDSMNSPPGTSAGSAMTSSR